MDFICDVLVFKFYGVFFEWLILDLLYCELIFVCSCLYDWEIKLYWYVDFVQLFYVCKGWVQFQVEGELICVEQFFIQFVLLLCIYGFQFFEYIDGYVLMFVVLLLVCLQVYFGVQCQVLEVLGLYLVGVDWCYIDMLFDVIDGEYVGVVLVCELLLQLLIGVLVVWLGWQVMVWWVEVWLGCGQEYLLVFL